MARTRRESIIFQAKASIQEINRIGTSKRKARENGELGIHSLKQYEHALSASMNFLKFIRSTFGIKRMEDLQEKHIIAYFDDMKARYLSEGHIRNVETGLRQLQKGYILRQERLGRTGDSFSTT
ncbi:hypothetical protein [Bacillus sp. JJ722]|uniref:hypothetical protein n=1 Tax=Bacillus sp. JJ722 TaxID=3122973 RepID=UPI002FFD8034